MAKAGRLMVRSAFVVAFLIAFVGIEVAQRSRQRLTPLGESPLIEFPNIPMSQSEVQRFLEGDFRLIKHMKALPEPVIKAFTETGGSRLTIANPGEKFEATDVIRDESVPRKRLLFAGVSGDKCFMLYEEGGIVQFYALALFKLSPASTMKPIGRTLCGPAVNLAKLRSNVSRGRCSDPVPKELQ